MYIFGMNGVSHTVLLSEAVMCLNADPVIHIELINLPHHDHCVDRVQKVYNNHILAEMIVKVITIGQYKNNNDTQSCMKYQARPLNGIDL